MVEPGANSSATLDVVLEAHSLSKDFTSRHVIAHRRTRRPASASRALRVVDGVDVTLRRGRVTALVGESGSGKSTLALLLAQLSARTGGEISLNGRPVSPRPGRSLRAYHGKVALIFQDPFSSLNPIHTVRYHLTRALRLHGHARRGPELPAALRALLGSVALTPATGYLDKLPHELSGGQRQRVAVARALATRPEVLIADEPVSMLDVSARLGVVNLLRELATGRGLAVLYITHDIASARHAADDMLVMYAGRIVERGEAEAVSGHPAHPYTRLLLDCAPDPDRAHRYGHVVDAPSAPSAAPDSGHAGCPFHARCPHATDICRERTPVMTETDGTGRHLVSCWLHDPEQPARPP